MVAVPSDHSLADRANIIIADVAQEPIIHYASGPACGVESEYLRTTYQDTGFEPNISVEYKNVESALGLVAAGRWPRDCCRQGQFHPWEASRGSLRDVGE